MNRYFAVETKCGHVGKDKCIFIWFAVKAENGKAAAARARGYKRVKHHHKYAIRQVREISFEEYVQLKLVNTNDPYLQCKNVQQQRAIEHFEDRIESDEDLLSKNNKRATRRDTAYLLKKNEIKTRDALRQIQDNDYDDDIAA
ncbi:MAG: hypothetical protein K2M89_06070 [Clostridiales bacterium]|nr:hypothetical protein [Clostridiales bacterium]